MFALTAVAKPVPSAAVPGLSPGLAAQYARKTGKTLARDLSALVAMDLVRRTPQGYLANKELMRAFLPLVHESAG